MAFLLTSNKFQAFDSSGNPLASGKVYTYAAGTTTPLASYTTQAGTVANANPVILDSTGRADIWLGASAYRILVKTSADVTVSDTDNVNITAPIWNDPETFTATESQTIFNLSDSASDAEVYINGLRIDAGDWTMTNPTRVTLDTGADEYDEVVIRGVSQ